MSWNLDLLRTYVLLRARSQGIISCAPDSGYLNKYLWKPHSQLKSTVKVAQVIYSGYEKRPPSDALQGLSPIGMTWVGGNSQGSRILGAQHSQFRLLRARRPLIWLANSKEKAIQYQMSKHVLTYELGTYHITTFKDWSSRFRYYSFPHRQLLLQMFILCLE